MDDYVELAFWASWAEAHGAALSHQDLIAMRDALRDAVGEMTAEYLDEIRAEDDE